MSKMMEKFGSNTMMKKFSATEQRVRDYLDLMLPDWTVKVKEFGSTHAVCRVEGPDDESEYSHFLTLVNRVPDYNPDFDLREISVGKDWAVVRYVDDRRLLLNDMSPCVEPRIENGRLTVYLSEIDLDSDDADEDEFNDLDEEQDLINYQMLVGWIVAHGGSEDPASEFLMPGPNFDCDQDEGDNEDSEEEDERQLSGEQARAIMKAVIQLNKKPSIACSITHVTFDMLGQLEVVHNPALGDIQVRGEMNEVYDNLNAFTRCYELDCDYKFLLPEFRF